MNFTKSLKIVLLFVFTSILLFTSAVSYAMVEPRTDTSEDEITAISDDIELINENGEEENTSDNTLDSLNEYQQKRTIFVFIR